LFFRANTPRCSITRHSAAGSRAALAGSGGKPPGGGPEQQKREAASEVRADRPTSLIAASVFAPSLLSNGRSKRVLGWIVCLLILASAYNLGWWVASYFGMSDREMVGLLSALTFVWIYEHRNAEFRYNRLRELYQAPALISALPARVDRPRGQASESPCRHARYA
jgi:hypothetical protein